MKCKWRMTEQGIQAIPTSTPVQWGPDAYDFESLELARFARLLTKGGKPRVPYRPASAGQYKSIATSA
ncbi:MAG: hypothetical protein KBF33_01655 [Comamonas sp.]|nr:hypothetical protein [Comamonas sp.]